ncbi:GerAB/ArcD/ProY family transporter [Psychrobacillus sp. FSL K6-2836]|uniref:GerAB/ArcD/ProY family transporter n=1 Tax=Psychrobacillus sp. FSL K6-2836 TaxID=2921548 RepID=UPI0030F59A07
MSRFLYYFIFLTMFSNIIASVPKILLFESKKGAIPSMIAAVIIGTLLVYIIVKLFDAIPGKSLPEMLKIHTPKWFAYPVLFYLFLCWFTAGLITLITYVFLFITFFSPETSIVNTTFAFVLVISFGVLMKSRSMLYMAEIVIVLFVPLIFFLLIKFFANPKLDWDFIEISMMHANHLPSYSAFGAALYIFVGITNLVIFNKLFTKKHKMGWKQLLIIGFTGMVVLFTTYFVPIGYNGFEQIEDFTFPWVSTSDSIRMKYGLIERVIFIFILSFLGIAFVSLLLHWHVALKILESIFEFKRLKWKGKMLAPYIFVIIFVVISLVLTRKLTQYQLFVFSSYFYESLPIFFTVLIISLVIVKRRAKL